MKKIADLQKYKSLMRKNIFLIIGIGWVIPFAIFFFLATSKNRDYKLVPEYKQTLSNVILSFSVNDKNLDFHNQLLSALPKYTHINLLVPTNISKSIVRELRGKPYSDHTVLLSYETKVFHNPRLALYDEDANDFSLISTADLLLPQGTKWIRDSFKSLTNTKGQSLLYLPITQKSFYNAGTDKQTKYIQDNIYIKQLSKIGLKVEYGPLFFEGGNILIGEINEKRIAFVGSNTIRTTTVIHKYLPKKVIDASEIKNTLLKTFGVDDVIFVGFGLNPQPKKMFHLDQAIIFLKDGVVGISHIVGKDPESPIELEIINETKLFLSQTRALLSSLGFEVYSVDITAQNVLNYEQYVNAIPYTNIKTKQREILMPVFNSNQTANDNQILNKNISLFESMGYHVIRVPVSSTELKGGIHCLINVVG
ncbi:MAG: agmatine deiminase family protein [Candidatus Anammoxibacter sp.]